MQENLGTPKNEIEQNPNPFKNKKVLFALFAVATVAVAILLVFVFKNNY
jgi:hypothetical protein